MTLPLSSPAGKPSVEQVPLLLEMEKIRKSFPGVLAVDDAGFRLKPGEIHALVGENGAGKSTLIKALTGVHRPDSGIIRHKGTEVLYACLLYTSDAADE